MILRTKTPAFTLIELLVSLVIAALAINVSYILINKSLLNEEKFENILDAKIESEYMFLMLQADIDEAISLPKGDNSAIRLESQNDDDKTITIKRLSWSPITNRLEPLTVIWKFSDGSITKSVLSPSMKADRKFILRLATFHFDWIDQSNIRLTIKHPKFHKSTIMFINATQEI